VARSGDEGRYRPRAEDQGVAARVHFAGATSEPGPYYSSADGFILPTAYETFSLVTFEAAAAGLPLLVSRVSGVDELLVDGQNGWYIDRDADVIARRLTELRDERLRRTLGSAARADSARFGWESALDSYDRLYRRMAAEVSE
jgi:glycosyltransferase involved in cell wall biosynthesis